MSAASTPTGRRQEKTMSSRLLTMKFMQRAAASSSGNNTSTYSARPSTPMSSAPRHSSNYPSSAKRQKLSPSTPRGNESTASTPQTAYHSSGASTPFSHERSNIGGTRNCDENAAETPWELHFPLNQENSHQQRISPPSSPISRDPSPLDDPVAGRRTFGNFKKNKKKQQPNTRGKSSATGGSEDDDDEDKDSLSSGEEHEDYESYSSLMGGRQAQMHSGSGKNFKDKRSRKDAHSHRRESDRMDTIDQRNLKSGGISAASGRRNTPSASERKFRVNKKKNTR